VYELGLAAHEQYDPASAREQGWTNQQNHRNKVVLINKTIGIKLYLSNKTIGIKLYLSKQTIGIKLYL
jgi:hypothetical protein